jgi:cyclophilin family peptidyl-prolyl cis-trans isomerase
MKREILQIIIILIILALAGWGISFLLNNQDNKETSSGQPQEESMQQKESNELLLWENPPAMQINTAKNYQAVLDTSKGKITIDLFEDKPQTINNFIFLARENFYKNVPFHRIIKGFMVQTGDPTGTGSGGPGYQFNDEMPIERDYKRGIVAMANAGLNTNGSQFFIMHQDYDLPKNYVIFGQVIEGLDNLDKIANVPVETSTSGEASKPVQKILLKNVEITEK